MKPALASVCILQNNLFCPKLHICSLRTPKVVHCAVDPRHLTGCKALRGHRQLFGHSSSQTWPPPGWHLPTWQVLHSLLPMLLLPFHSLNPVMLSSPSRPKLENLDPQAPASPFPSISGQIAKPARQSLSPVGTAAAPPICPPSPAPFL